MKVPGLVGLLGLAVTATVLLTGQLGLFAGQMPADIGVHDGILKPPSNTPNSVSSQTGQYPKHPQAAYASIAPLMFAGGGEDALQRLALIIKHTDRCTLVTQHSDYLYAQCSTTALRFTDDVEFWLDRKASVIQLRSASRLGHSDMGVNRARMEKIRAQFQQN